MKQGPRFDGAAPRRVLNLLASLTMAGCLAACGGGGNAGNAGSGTPVATAPVTTTPVTTTPVTTTPVTTTPVTTTPVTTTPVTTTPVTTTPVTTTPVTTTPVTTTPVTTTPVTTTPVTTTPVTTTPVTTTPVTTTPVTTTPVTTPPASSTPTFNKSVKRGIAYDLNVAADMSALAPGVSWWYNWASKPAAGVPVDYATQYGMDFLPMLWNDNFDASAITAYIQANKVKYLLLLNEPNLNDQARMTPQQAAALWPRYEAIAASTGVKLVGPAMNWGTMENYADPVVWLDAFYAAYASANDNRKPQIDYLAFHWYDYGLAGQLDRLTKYGKPFWVTEMANFHSQNDGAQIDTLAKQKAQMTEMVKICEDRADVFRYAWFIGRMSPDTHYTSLLGASGQLTELGQVYISLPFKTAKENATGNAVASGKVK